MYQSVILTLITLLVSVAVQSEAPETARQLIQVDNCMPAAAGKLTEWSFLSAVKL